MTEKAHVEPSNRIWHGAMILAALIGAISLCPGQMTAGYGVAMRYRYELFPPAVDGYQYLKEVPQKYHGELVKMAAQKPPEVTKLWEYITEVTMPMDEDGFLIPVGSENVDPNLKVVVSLGRNEERPKLVSDESLSRPKFAEGAEYIGISVEATEDDSEMILYNQAFPIPKNFNESNFEFSNAVKIDRKERSLSVMVPGAEHVYRLPDVRQMAGGEGSAAHPESK